MPNFTRNTVAAKLLGLSAGSRTFTPEAVMVMRGRIKTEPLTRNLILAAAAGEIIGDKLPFVPARIKPLPYLGRVASGAFCGNHVDGQRGALIGAIGAAAGASIGYQARKRATKAPFFAALLEDAVAIGIANLALLVAGD